MLKFDEFLRVVIGTGNLFVEDWDYWNNIFYIQDFPLKSKEFKENNYHKEFIKDFHYYLKASL